MARYRDSHVALLPRVVEWYFATRYGRDEGGDVLPFYCDEKRVGWFAVDPEQLAAGTNAATYRLFVTLAQYQGVRDVVVMQRQRGLPKRDVVKAASLPSVARAVQSSFCEAPRSKSFVTACDVRKHGNEADCSRHPGTKCHVKDATAAFKRMGDMGKLPTSAYLTAWRDDGVRREFERLRREVACPCQRAALLVAWFQDVHRVGRKLSTMFVSALSTPALAMGLAPWFPTLDGNELAVIDTNVRRAIDLVCKSAAPRTYASRERWIQEQARHINLRAYHSDVPAYSPRLVQQALYAFCSRSNRIAAGDPCATSAAGCAQCAPELCPFSGSVTAHVSPPTASEVERSVHARSER